jgi:hypothetical protein
VAVYCGIDWAEGHHDIALVDDEGKLVAKRRINESLEGSGSWPRCSPRQATASRSRFRWRSRHRADCWWRCCDLRVRVRPHLQSGVRADVQRLRRVVTVVI